MSARLKYSSAHIVDVYRNASCHRNNTVAIDTPVNSYIRIWAICVQAYAIYHCMYFNFKHYFSFTVGCCSALNRLFAIRQAV